MGGHLVRHVRPDMHENNQTRPKDALGDDKQKRECHAHCVMCFASRGEIVSGSRHDDHETMWWRAVQIWSTVCRPVCSCFCLWSSVLLPVKSWSSVRGDKDKKKRAGRLRTTPLGTVTASLFSPLLCFRLLQQLKRAKTGNLDDVETCMVLLPPLCMRSQPLSPRTQTQTQAAYTTTRIGVYAKERRGKKETDEAREEKKKKPPGLLRGPFKTPLPILARDAPLNDTHSYARLPVCVSLLFLRRCHLFVTGWGWDRDTGFRIRSLTTSQSRKACLDLACCSWYLCSRFSLFYLGGVTWAQMALTCESRSRGAGSGAAI